MRSTPSRAAGEPSAEFVSLQIQIEDAETRAASGAHLFFSTRQAAPDVLAAAGIADRFPVVVHGGVAAAAGIAGKPSPDTYTYAAQQLTIDSGRCVVFEDAISGVQAGASGEFALVVGVDRGAGAETLISNGAEVVVSDLAELI